MKVYILNEQYEKIGYIDQAESILWNKKYNDVGECEVYVSADEEMVNLLQKGHYIYREDDDMFCKIDSVEVTDSVEDGDYIIAKGTDMNNIFSNRIVRWSVTYSGKVVDYLKRLIIENVIVPEQEQRRINNLVFNDSNFNEFTETINVNAFTDDLLEIVKTTCKTFNYGFRVKYLIDTKTLEFGLYKGQNKAIIENDGYVEFSPTYSNIISSSYKQIANNYKNVCYVGYKNSNDELQLLQVFNTETEPVGEERKEIYVDGSSVSRDVTVEELRNIYPDVYEKEDVYYSILNDVETAVAKVEGDKIVVNDNTYSKLLAILGYNTLAERNYTQEFIGEVDTIDTYDYKVDYDLGDIVKVINKYGIGAEARITEIMESDDTEDGYVVEPKFEYNYEIIIEPDTPITPVVMGRMLMESGQTTLTETNEIVLLEEANQSAVVPSKKISELEVATDVQDGCCIPIVSNGETKKVYFSTLKECIVNEMGSNDYNELINKPQINDVELKGNKSFKELGLSSMDAVDILAILD